MDLKVPLILILAEGKRAEPDRWAPSLHRDVIAHQYTG